MTNSDKIRALKDWEIAYLIAYAPYCAHHEKCIHMDVDPAPCHLCALDWLRQEVSADA